MKAPLLRHVRRAHCPGVPGERGADGQRDRAVDLGNRACQRASVVGAAQLASVDIVRNNRDIHTVLPDGEESTFVFTDDLNDVPDVPELYYCIRVTQSDGEMVWSSPVWVGLTGMDAP